MPESYTIKYVQLLSIMTDMIEKQIYKNYLKYTYCFNIQKNTTSVNLLITLMVFNLNMKLPANLINFSFL